MKIEKEDLQKRFYSLDIIKAFSIFLVLIWHLQPINFLNIDTSASFSLKLLNKTTLVFYKEITLIAVPSFFLVSLYLFFLKSKNKSSDYFKKRILRLCNIFITWSIFQTLFYFIVINIDQFDDRPIKAFSSISFVFYTLRMGGPSLPIVGDSVFYFVFNLIALYSLGYLALTIKKTKIRDYLLILCFAVSIVIFELKGNSIKYYSLLNFLVYIPVSYWLASCNIETIKRRHATTKNISIISIVFLLLILKNQFFGGGGIYSRSSLVIGSFLLFLTAFQIEDYSLLQKLKFFVLPMSTFSLGLFATHKYWQLLFESILNLDQGIYRVGSLDSNSIASFFLTIFCSFTFSLLVSRQDILKKYVN